MPTENTPSSRDEGEQIALEQDLLRTLEAEIASNRLVLPTLPEIALRVRELMAQPDCSATQLARLISSDAALAARLLKVANSSSYRGHKTIDNIQTAITRLGMQLVRSLVTQLALLQSLHGSNADIGRQLAVLSRHSLEIGAHCHALAQCYTKLDPEEALLAGLVHDIGKLPLLLRLRSLGGTGEMADQLARRLHGRVGAMVLEAWHFTPEMVAVAAGHEDVQRNPYGAPDYTDVVLLSHLLLHLRQNRQQPWAEQLPVFRKLRRSPQQMLDDDMLAQHTRAALERLST
ncbi:MAG: HDOD domain-containing protein [Pseudomonadota bacterium]